MTAANLRRTFDSVRHTHEQYRPTRSQFEKWFVNRDVSLVIMEACGSAHPWARQLNALGIEVKLLPAAYQMPDILEWSRPST